VLISPQLRAHGLRAQSRSIKIGKIFLSNQALLRPGRTRTVDTQASFFDVPETLICTADFDGRLTRVGIAWEATFGYRADDLIGRPVIDLVHPDDVATTLAALSALRTGKSVVFESRLRGAGGDTLWLRWNAAADVQTELVHAIAVDVSATKQFEREIARRAVRDELTDLPNRVLFIDRVDTGLAQLARRESTVAVVMIDIDDFHVVNETLGRAAGDEVLVEVARRLCQAIRTSDSAARVGADEFAVLCIDVDETALLEIAERLRAAVAAPVEVRGRSLKLSTSAGIAVAHSPRVGEMLVADAEVALHHAASNGDGRIEFFDRALRAESLARMELQLALREAIADGELTLVYQPVVDLQTSEAIAFEALVRWRHPDRGLLGPNTFIPLAEETGLIHAIGAWVLHAACREATRWHPRGDAPAPAVSVNLSARQLSDPEIVVAVSEALETAKLDPSRLWLELTETAVLGNLDACGEVLGSLQELGVRIALDDFGEGHSSLIQLNHLTPVSVLKIGAPFVAQVDDPESRGAAVVRAMLGVGRQIGLQTIAEGIETAEQLNALRSLGCSAGQGYHLARPQPAAMIDGWLEPAAFAGAG
jgi:diguanylate cyclase (GGDEF)-like protein/PAS domain S-box-containing protein